MKPTVSIIIPCFNESRRISGLLEAIDSQTYPTEQMEVVVADGFSNDGTRDVIANFIQQKPHLAVKVVDNPKRIIPAGVNAAVRSSTGEIIIRLDGHSKPDREYISRCVQDLEQKRGDNVGGVWKIIPADRTWLALSIALAAAHRLGVGDAQYRLGGQAGPVDTVPFGAFRRSLFDRLGGFNEDLLTNEDYEFNARIRREGGVVWFDPDIQTDYYARSNLGELARQYFRYGFWKQKMLRMHPGTLRWRQALPPLFVISIPVLALAAVFFPLFDYLLAFELAVYLSILLLTGSIIALKHRNIGCIIGFPAAIATMHFCWGAGFLWSMIKQ